ncbi:hypothetical protein F5Y18DRAFT_369810 [Xylariaceae sp. FL1019]|nr:hypothetical protein F5Y18DRAFT_369810 [Xylariaceae sp. FL1019]
MIPSINSQATQAALLEWADAMLVLLPSKREPGTKIQKIDDLFDGTLFSLLLEIMDARYSPDRFNQNLAASKTENEKRRNLHIIYIGLMDFVRRVCPKVEPLIKAIDFQALDKSPTKPGMIEILVVFVCTACFMDDDNVQYVALIQKLGGEYQQSIFTILQEVQAKLDEGIPAVDSENPASARIGGLDADLAHEAAIADLKREVDEAKRTAGGLKLRLDRLQDSYDELVRKHEDVQTDNEKLQKQIESEAGNFNRHRLQQHVKENETLIANLENERNVLIEEKAKLLKDKTRLEIAAQKAQVLIDENQELKSKNEELSKKANMADNLRKKVESTKHLEAELNTLRNDKIDLHRAYEQLAAANRKVKTLREEGEAYASKMQGYEMDIHDMREQKAMIQSNNYTLMARVKELETRSQNDEVVVKDLQEKVMMLDPGATTDDPLAVRPTSLEDELSESSNTLSMRSLEVQRLQAENAVLKSTIGSETDKGALVQEMEDLRASRQAVQDRYNDIFEKFTVGQKQLDTLIQNMSENGLVTLLQKCYEMAPGTKWLMSDYFREEAYANLRTQVLAEQSRSKQFERQLEAVKEQLADKERALLEARGDCKAIFMEYVMNADDADDEEKVNAVEKSSVDALTELKNTDGMLAQSLRAELEVERRRYKLLKDEQEAQQKQLLTAFIEKDELRREAERANLDLQKAADGQTVSTDYIKQSEKIEKLRTRYKQLHQQYEQSEVKGRDLERTLKAVRAGTEASEKKAQTDQIIKNLQRENALITTAWYDLTSRLQSNHVVLQRRSDAPKSWLNRQRQLVNATPRR